MRLSTRITLFGAGALVGGIAGAVLLAGRAWERETAAVAARVATAADGAPSGVYDPDSLAGLPAPVARYFERSLAPGQPRVRSARIEHAGEFRTGLEAEWRPFRSVQHFSANPPAFVWDARIEMVPVVGVRVRDSYLGGSAAMLGKVGGLIPVVDQAGSAELASGALHRYLAESAWLPTALLPRPGLSWAAVDDSTARVTLSDSGIAVSLDVHFTPAGDIERVEGERYRDVDGVGVLTPFVGRFRDYAEADGMRIPMAGEVEWILPAGPLAYWRGRIERVEYRYAE